MSPEKRSIFTIMVLATVLYPFFYLLDLVVYPQYKLPLLLIRLVVIAWLLISFAVLGRVKEKGLPLFIWVFFLPCAIGISLMCVVVKEGFASPYYAGLFLVIAACSGFLRFRPRQFSPILLAIIGQHFLLQLFLPFKLRDVMIDLFFLGSAVFITSIVQLIIYNLSEKIKLMEGLLPICASCKKIRDKNGAWNQIEQYIKERSGAEFTHGLCPDCAERLYGVEKIKAAN